VGNGSRVPKRALGEKPRLGDEILAARGWVDNRTVAVVGREATPLSEEDGSLDERVKALAIRAADEN
jgi:hypothetical protein